MKKMIIVMMVGVGVCFTGILSAASNGQVPDSKGTNNFIKSLRVLQVLQPVVWSGIDTTLRAVQPRRATIKDHIKHGRIPLNWQTVASIKDVELYSLFTSIDLGGYGDNLPPYQPANPNPPDGSTNNGLSLTLYWDGGDPNPEDTVVFDVYFGTEESPPFVAGNITYTSYSVSDLIPDTVYYWKIVARDNWGAETTGQIWHFRTIANNPPYEPVNPIPPDGATNVDVNVDLSWQCNDPDPGDVLTFDVYFGTDETPPKVAENISSPTFEPGTMQFNTVYYWKIIARDSQGAETSGPVWSFVTRDQSQPTATPTHPPCTQYAVQLDMGSNYFCPGDTCFLYAYLCNPGETRFIPLFVVLDIEGSYWFAPSWSQDVDYYLDVVPHDWSTKEIIPAFTWPDVEGSYSNINFWGAFTNQEYMEILGEYDLYTFGYGPCH